MNNNTENQIHKYDRKYGNLLNVSLATKPSTVKLVEPLTGRAETFIVQTLRHEDGDYLFIEQADEEGLTRICLPPRVTQLVASHRDSLTRRSRSRASKIVMAERKARGEVFGFQKKAKPQPAAVKTKTKTKSRKPQSLVRVKDATTGKVIALPELDKFFAVED